VFALARAALNLVSMLRSKDARQPEPRTTMFDNREYVSVSRVAEILGRSVRTVRRWEKSGRMPRPVEIPRGTKGMRWYLRSTIEDWGQTLAAGGRLADLDFSAAAEGDGQAAPHRSWTEFAGKSRRRARPQTDLGDWADVNDWVGDIRTNDPRPLPPSRPVESLCPHCGLELEWKLEPIPGAMAAFGETPHCPRHGDVNLNIAQPAPGSCGQCGGLDVFEEKREGVKDWVSVCVTCGDTTTVPEPRQPQPEPLSFVPLAPPEPPRRRGLQLGDVSYVTRVSRPVSRPGPTFLPPRDGG
jgi:predicted DNA-binding transcriptional regulator AlpA